MLTKLLIFTISTLCVSVCLARPGYLHGHHHHLDYPLVHHEPYTFAKYVHIPAAVSHQSSTIIHGAPIIKPLIVKTLVPVIKSYHTAPIIKTLHYDPFYHHHHYDDHHGFHHYH